MKKEFKYTIKDLENGTVTINDIASHTNLSTEQIEDILKPQLNEKGYDIIDGKVIKQISLDIMDMIESSDVVNEMEKSLLAQGMSKEDANESIKKVFEQVKNQEQITIKDDSYIRMKNFEDRKNKTLEYYKNLIKTYLYKCEQETFNLTSLEDMPQGNPEIIAYYIYLIDITRELYKYREQPNVLNFLYIACERLIDNFDLFICNMVDYDVEHEQYYCAYMNKPFDFVEVYKDRTERNKINPEQFIDLKRRLEYLKSKL